VVRRSAGAPDAAPRPTSLATTRHALFPAARPARHREARRSGASRRSRQEPSMRRYTAHLTFTLVALWVIVVFVLVSNSTN